MAQLISQTLEQERRQREAMEQQYAQYDADDDEVSYHSNAHCRVFSPFSIWKLLELALNLHFKQLHSCTSFSFLGRFSNPYVK